MVPLDKQNHSSEYASVQTAVKHFHISPFYCLSFKKAICHEMNVIMDY